MRSSEVAARLRLVIEDLVEDLQRYCNKPNPSHGIVKKMSNRISELTDIYNSLANAGDILLWSQINERIQEAFECDPTLTGIVINIGNENDTEHKAHLKITTDLWRS